MGSPTSHKGHGTRSYPHGDIRSAVNYSQSALATSAPLAWAYVGALSVSFMLACWVLQQMHPISSQHWEAFNEQVPSWVFTGQVAAFGGVLLLNLINLMFCSAPVQYNCNVLLVLIHGVAFATDYLLELNATPVVVSWSGRMFVPLRYIQWVHTTPTMILLMAMMSSTSRSGVLAAVVADLVMVLTGLAATWTAGATQMVCLALSMAAFMVVMASIVDMFKGALVETAHDPAVHGLMEKLLWLTLLVWTLFPLVWMAAWAGYLTLGTEQLFWGVSDYGAKVVFSSHLWQKNLATVQQRREATQELLSALDRGVLLERLRGLLAAKERLVHALQHELTTPIHGMMALVQELLHNKTQSASSRTRMLLMIRSSAVCLLNTISTALSSSSTPDDKAGHMNGDRLDSQGGNRRVHKVHLWRVAESVVRLTRPLMRDHVRILNCISKDLPPVQGDSARLMQVLMNLVCSSLKYTHSGSIKISASSTHSVAQVVVADTGAGIPPQQLKQALDPFDMLDGHSSIPGSQSPELWDVCRAGLGLYLVKQTLGSMGSELSASSELGKGSTFEFDMPLADSDCESESEADADLFSEPTSLRGSLDLLVPSEPSMQLRRSLDLSLNTSGGQPRSNNSSTRDLHTSAVLRAAAAATGNAAAGSNGSSGGSTAAAGGAVGASLLSGAGGVGSAVGAMDAAAAAAGAGLVRKQNHRAVHNGVIQVLSVDDDPVNQLVASTALKIHKWEVVKCMSGAEALDYLLQRCSVLPDLVLLDVMMPTMSGYEVAKRIREVWPSSLLPIIMVSAKTEEDDIVQGLRCGADDYVPKPFKRAELAARIRAHIRARDAFQQQQATEQQWMLQHNLLPLNVQRKLRNGETVIAESHPAATVLWAEVLGGPAAAVGGVAAAAAGGTTAASAPGQHPLQEALKRISSQQQLAAAAAGGDTAASAAAAAAAEGGGVDGSSSSNGLVVSRSGSALGLMGLEAGPLGLGAFPPGLSPAEAVVRLNSLYTTWEELCAQQDVLGVDFSGSTFVAVSGHDDHPNHASLILRAAAAMLSVAAASTQSDGSPLAVRLGIHTGPLTTGLVGSKAVKLVLMGDTVEGARQLAATGCPGAAHISSEVYAALQPPAAAAAAPWTHQRLPGAVSRQQTYLLRTQDSSSSGGGTAAASAPAAAKGAAGSGKQEASAAQQQDKQQQQQGQQQSAAGASGIGESSAAAAPDGDRSSRSGDAAAGQPNGMQQKQKQPAAPAAAAAAGDAAAATAQQSSTSTGVPPPAAAVTAAAATAAVPGGGGGATASKQFGGGIGGSSSSSKPPSQHQPLLRLQDDDDEDDEDTGEVTLSHAAQVPAAAGPAAAGSSSSGPAVTPSSSNVQPSPQQRQQQQWQQYMLLSPNARMELPSADSPPPSRMSVATAVSSLAVTPAGPRGLGHSTSSSDSKLPYLAAVTAAADAAAAPAAAAATAATAAMVSCLTGGPGAVVNSSSSSSGGRGLYGSASAGDVASLLALQQAGSALISQLGVERRQLQQQLLERTQQHAAAAAELACVKQQLQQASATAEQRGTQVEALRQQVSSLMVRAHLADCWQSLATMKSQVGLLGTATPLLGVPGSLDLKQLQQQQVGQLQGLGGATTAAALLQQTQQLQQLVQMQMLPPHHQQQQVSFPSHHQAIQLSVPTVSHGMGVGAGGVGAVPGAAAVSQGLLLGGVGGGAMQQQQHPQHLEQQQQQQQRQWLQQ